MAMVRSPTLSPNTHSDDRRNTGKQYSEEGHKEGIRGLDTYKHWWLDTILETGVKNSIVVMQSEDDKPNYCDDTSPYVHLPCMKEKILMSLVVITFKMHGIHGGSCQYLERLR
jgi:hypothetical protein